MELVISNNFGVIAEEGVAEPYRSEDLPLFKGWPLVVGKKKREASKTHYPPDTDCLPSNVICCNEVYDL